MFEEYRIYPGRVRPRVSMIAHFDRERPRHRRELKLKERISKKEFESFLYSKLIRETEAYLKRGRRFVGVPSEELRDRWIRAFKAHC